MFTPTKVWLRVSTLRWANHSIMEWASTIWGVPSNWKRLKTRQLELCLLRLISTLKTSETVCSLARGILLNGKMWYSTPLRPMVASDNRIPCCTRAIKYQLRASCRLTVTPMPICNPKCKALWWQHLLVVTWCKLSLARAEGNKLWRLEQFLRVVPNSVARCYLCLARATGCSTDGSKPTICSRMVSSQYLLTM